MTSPAEMLTALDDALAHAKQQRLRSRDRVMHIVSRDVQCLGCRGAVADRREDGSLVVTYTLKQVRSMHRTLTAALRAEFESATTLDSLRG